MVLNLLLVPWGSYKYLACPIGPANYLLHARDHLLALLDQLVPWGSNKYLACPIGPANYLLHARDHLLALLDQQDIYCWSKGPAKD